MARGTRKQRHEAKRKAKRLQARRRMSVSPLKRLAEATGQIECWMSDRLEGFGQAQIFIYKEAPALSGIACFLVDRGVVGLKDAWTKLNVPRVDFDDMLQTSAERGIAMQRVALDDGRRLIAGAIRWAHENGMRLPRDWAKTASLIGGVGQWMAADVSAFVKEFAGHPDDLRQRLITEPFESYIQRADIQFEFLEDAPYMDQQSGEYFDEVGSEPDEEELENILDEFPGEEMNTLLEHFLPAATELAEETAKWLAKKNQTPVPQLAEAWQSIMLARMLSKIAMPNATEDEVSNAGYELLRNIITGSADSEPAQPTAAIAQALEHLLTDPPMMQNAILKCGLGNDAGKIGTENTTQPND